MATKFIGPWSGGLNLNVNRNFSTFLTDNELGEATNITYTAEGFVQPRPGCKMFISTGSTDLYAHTGNGGLGGIKLLGHVDVGSEGVYALVAITENTDTYLYKVRDHDDVTLLYHNANSLEYTHMIIHSGFTGSGFDYDYNQDGTPDYHYPADTGVILFTSVQDLTYILPLNLDTVTTPIVMVDPKYKIPISDMGMVVKDRLFLFNSKLNKMYWSPPTQILDFRQFNEANPGPPKEPISVTAPFGEDTAGEENIEPTTPDDIIRSFEFKNNNFYIFKRNSTFMFTYQNNPTTDGYMRKISDTMGAFDSTNYKDNIVVINNKGVFRVENTTFIDLQEKMNFRFEIPLDHPKVKLEDIFITNFNDILLFGFRDTVTNPNTYKYYYYAMNGLTGAWSKWDFTYAQAVEGPGSSFVFCQKPNTTKLKMLFVDFWRQNILFMYWKPSPDIYDYHLDSNYRYKDEWDEFYFPAVTIKTSASFGDSLLKFKKLFRYYIRFYLAEQPVAFPEYPVWTISLNYNNYNFNAADNPKFNLYPEVTDDSGDNSELALYKRTYQISMPQQRAKEFVFELKRRYTTIPYGEDFINTDSDRPIDAGYYFLLSGFWFDYDNKAAI